MPLIQKCQAFGGDGVAVTVAVRANGRDQPSLIYPEKHFLSAHTKCLAYAFEREEIASNISKAELIALENAADGIRRSLEFLGDFRQGMPA